MCARNRFHPKNIYKNPPNFKELAIEFPEFRKYVRQELSGRCSIDYQDPKAIKELTKTLLKKDFNLDVEINEKRLIPRVPLCLNYILWIEDLLNLLKTNTTKLGIDIGTGNVCIYSLLGAKKGWKMLATEIDPENFESAKNNINKNSLSDMISLKLNANPEKLLIGLLDSNVTYDFCMCNPPFFDYNEKPSNRTLKRLILKSTASDTPSEICTTGGEVLFIKQLIKESLELKDQVKIFTTLIGKKSDFLFLRKELQAISPKSQAFTEFYQGRTMRWGIAWTFFDISLKLNEHLVKTPKNKKAKIPLTLIFPSHRLNNLGRIFDEIKNIFINLNIFFEEQRNSHPLLIFKAYENTWSHQRRKKRLEARIRDVSKESQNESFHSLSNSCDDSKDNYESPSPKKVKKDLDHEMEKDKNIIVEGFITLKENDTPAPSVILEMFWLSGNKEFLHQLFQYFKNHWGDLL